MKIIYDIGAHKGEEIEYYLLKADKVVSVDANPYAIDEVRRNFHQYIAAGRLVVIHSAVGSYSGETVFNVNHKQSVLSTSDIAADKISKFGELCSEDAWETITVPANRLSEIIHAEGDPYFIKIDVEGGEEAILADLYRSNIRPQYISAEVGWSFSEAACYLYLMGYREFQLVNMNTLEGQFKGHVVKTNDGRIAKYDFKRGSSGPFGDDLPEWWVDFQRLWFLIATRELIFGDDPWHWYDVHARFSDSTGQ